MRTKNPEDLLQGETSHVGLKAVMPVQMINIS